MHLTNIFHSLDGKWPKRNDLNGGFYKLLFLEAGEGIYQIGRKTFPVFSGSFITSLTNKEIDLSKLNGTGWLIIFRNSLDKEYFAVNSKSERINVPAEYGIKWLERFYLIEYEFNRKQIYSEDYIRTTLELVLIDIRRISDDKLAEFNPLIDKSIRFIKNNYSQPISLSDVAKFVDRSPSYLTNLFREKTGKTVLEYIIKQRMSKAEILLIETDCSIEKISEKVGYLDSRYFCRRFKERHGLSPGVWRQLKQYSNRQKMKSGNK